MSNEDKKFTPDRRDDSGAGTPRTVRKTHRGDGSVGLPARFLWPTESGAVIANSQA